MSQTIAPVNAPFKVQLGGEACEGRSDFRIKLDFSLGLSQYIDFATWINQATIKSVQGLYVDNSGGANSVNFTMSGTGQVMTVPAGAQAYLPVLASNPPNITVDCANNTQITFLQVLNFFVPPYIWGGTVAIDIPAIDAIISGGRMNVRTTPQGLTALTDRSGTITVGGTGQSLMAANPARTQWTLANPSTATEILQFSKISVAGPWYDLLAGASVQESGDTIYQGQIWVKGATAAHAFTADEGTV